MIMVSAPLRISFLGGGTDFPSWFEHNDGMVISTTIDQSVKIIISKLAPIWGTKYKFSYSQLETVNHVDDIKHPLIRHCIDEYACKDDKLSIIYVSDLPGNSGLGSSSAFCAGMISGLRKINGEPELSKHHLSLETIRIERDVLKEVGGWQDQITSVYGGFNQIVFKKNSFKVNALNQSFISKYLEKCYLIYVGNLRKAHEVSIDQEVLIKDKYKLYREMLSLMEPALKAIKKNDFNEFSRLIDYGWNLKKEYSTKITNFDVDDAVDKLKRMGGKGIKLLGAGSGGFLLSRFENEFSYDKFEKFGFNYTLPIKETTEGASSKVIK